MVLAVVPALALALVLASEPALILVLSHRLLESTVI